MNATATVPSRTNPPSQTHRNNGARAAAIPHDERDDLLLKPAPGYAPALAIVADQIMREALPAYEIVEQKLSAILFILPDGCKAAEQALQMLEALDHYDEEQSRFAALLKDQNRAAHFAPASL